MVAFEGGLIQIHNLASGEMLFNRQTKDPLKVEHEASVLISLNEMAPFWFVAGCWEGEIAFFSKPQSLTGKEYVKVKRLTRTEHLKDVSSIALNRLNSLASASGDNVICFWDCFTAN